MIDLINPDFKAAIFDLDGTVFDSMGFWNRIDERFLAHNGVDIVPEDYLLAIAHLGAEETALYTKERFGINKSPEEMMSEWNADAVNFYTNEVTLKKGAYEYLKKLHNAGIKLAVATASSEELFIPGLRRCGIENMFSAYAAVNECSRRKDHPDVYELACRRMGADICDTVVFEDIYAAICGAADGGFRTVGVYDSTSARDEQLIRQKADMYITSFEQLL